MAYTGTIKNNRAGTVKFSAVIAGSQETISMAGHSSMYTEFDSAGADFVALIKQGVLSATGSLAQLAPQGRVAVAPVEKERTPATLPDLVNRLSDTFKKVGVPILPGELQGVTSGALRISAAGLEILDTGTNTWRLITFVNGELTFTQV
jgi:hypothetical protein